MSLLDGLNPKQLAKEYKTVGKALKNKDEDVKKEALGKLVEDSRYLNDGGCILPLLEMIAPKKKTLDFSGVALEGFLKMLTAQKPVVEVEGEEADATPAEGAVDDSSSAAIGASLQILTTIQTMESNQDALQVISDMVVFKDEVKKVKPPKLKKGEVAPPVPPHVDTELSVLLRNGSLKCIHHFVRALSHPDTARDTNPKALKELCENFSKIPGLATNLCTKIVAVADVLAPPPAVVEATMEGEEEEERGEGEAKQEAETEEVKEPTEEELVAKEALEERMREEGQLALASLALLLRHSAQACQELLASKALALLTGLAKKDDCFVSAILGIVDALSLREEGEISGLRTVSQPLYLDMLLYIASTSAEQFGSEEEDEKESTRSQRNRQQLVFLDSIVRTFTHFAKQQRAKGLLLQGQEVDQEPLLILTADNASVFVTCLCKVLVSPLAWEVSRTPGSDDIELKTFANYCCELLGLLGLLGAHVRKAVCVSSAVESLLTVLQSSTDVVGPCEDEENASVDARTLVLNRVWALRCVAERALLYLLTENTDNTEGSNTSTSLRWTSCADFATDEDFFLEQQQKVKAYAEEEIEKEEGANLQAPSVFLTQAVQLVENNPEDQDLSNRGVRLLAALFGGSSDMHMFATAGLNVTDDLTSKLTDFALARSSSIVDDHLALKAALAQKAATDAQAEDIDGEQVEKPAEEEKGQEEAVAEGGGVVETAMPASVLPATDVFTLSSTQSLYLALSVVEVLLDASTAHVELFATEENISKLAEAIFVTGPTSVSDNGVQQEERPELPDPRINGVISGKESYSALLRPLVVDIFTKVVTSSNATPSAVTAEEGKEASPVDVVGPSASSLLICRLCADACFATLSCEANFGLSDSGLVTTKSVESVESIGVNVLDTFVLDACLRYVASVTSCGIEGIEAALLALSAAGIVNAENTENKEQIDGVKMGAVEKFKLFLDTYAQNVRAPAEAEEGEEQSEPTPLPIELLAASASAVWGKPAAFVEILGDSEASTSTGVTGVTNLISKPVLWPLVVVMNPLLGVLGNPKHSTATISLALQVVAALCQPPTPSNGNGSNDNEEQAQQEQEALVEFDAFCALALGLGGAVSVLGASSPYGKVDTESTDFTMSLEFCSYLFLRGAATESTNTAPAVEEGGEKEKEKEEEVDKAEPTGLTKALWATLLDTQISDLHQQTQGSAALLSAVQAGLQSQALCLIEQGVNVNRPAQSGVTPLMYALLLGQEEVSEALVKAGADVNAVDLAGHPCIKYAFSTLGEDMQAQVVQAKKAAGSNTLLKFFGSGGIVKQLVDAKADLQIGDPEGNSALHYAVGLSKLEVSLGGQIVEVCGGAYRGQFSDTDVCATVNLMLTQGNGLVNACNKKGQVALHAASARGHIELMQLLVQLGAIVNAKDLEGMLPLHYIAACCPSKVDQAFEEILGKGQFCPVRQMEYSFSRMSTAKEERSAFDIDSALDDIFAQAVNPQVVYEERYTFPRLVELTTTNGVNLLQLLMSGHTLKGGHSDLLSQEEGQKERRMRAVLDAIAKWRAIAPGSVKILIAHSAEHSHFSCLHAASLLFQGNTPLIELTDAQKRSKRVKSYESDELALLATLAEADNFTISVKTSTSQESEIFKQMGINGTFPVSEWTVLHAAVAVNNTQLVTQLLAGTFGGETQDGNNEIDLADSAFSTVVDLVAERSLSSEMASLIIGICDSTPSYHKLLSNNSDLLVKAWKAGNLSVTELLLNCPKVNPNAKVKVSVKVAVECVEGKVGGTSGEEILGERALFHEIVLETISSGDYTWLNTFSTASDRLDFLVQDTSGMSCVDAALDSGNVSLIKSLFEMRSNDFIERLLAVEVSGSDLSADGTDGSDGSGQSALARMEQENIALAKKCGFLEKEKEKISEESAEVDESAEGEGAAEEKTVDVDVHEAEKEKEKEPEIEEGEVAAVAVEIVVCTPTAGDLAALDSSNGLLKLFLEYVGGLVGEDAHAHACFSSGLCYSEFCSQ